MYSFRRSLISTVGVSMVNLLPEKRPPVQRNQFVPSIVGKKDKKGKPKIRHVAVIQEAGEN